MENITVSPLFPILWWKKAGHALTHPVYHKAQRKKTVVSLSGFGA